MRLSWSPLTGRAPFRHAADRLWLILLVVTFVLVSAAAAGGPLVVEAAQNASVRRVLDASSDAAAVRQQPLLRITGGRGAPAEGTRPSDLLADVPGLAAPQVLGVSFGDELTSTGSLWRSVVAPSAGGAEPVDRRLAAVDDPTQVLVPVADTPGTPVGGGVWIDETAAGDLGVQPGDEVRVSVTTRDSRGSVVLPVAGVYLLATGLPRPVDVEGSTFWRDLAGRLPQATGFDQVQPPLITDVATLQTAAEPLEEQVLWSLEAGLEPAVPTLRQLVATAEAIDELPRQLPPLSDVDGPVGRYLVAGGVPGLQELSTAIATTAVDRTRGVAWSALALAMLAVLVVTVVDDARRRQERRLEAALGLHPLQVGGLRVLEVAPLAAIGGVVGVAIGWGVVAVWGPDGTITRRGLLAAAGDAATVVLGALLLVFAVAALSAWSTGRLSVAAGTVDAPGVARRIPWRTALVVAAAAAVAGVLTSAGAGGGLEVVAPLLVAAGCGAVLAGAGKSLSRRLTRRAGPPRGKSRGEPRRATGVVHPRTAERLSPRRAWTVLALRRLSAPGDGQDAVVVLLSAGLAMAGFVALADRSLTATVESKSAVLAGAATVVELPSGEALALAPDAVPRPVIANPYPYDQQLRPLDLDLDPGTDIPVPQGDTVVWVDRVDVAGGRQWPVLVLDTDTAPAALDFGRGSGALVEARAALAELNRQAAARAPGDGDDPLPPVLLVGERRGIAVGDVVEVRGTYSLIRVQVVGSVPVFPGQGSVTSLLVADTDTYLPALQLDDPRYVPDGTQSPLELQAEYWSSRGAPEVAALVRDSGLAVDEVRSAATQRLQPGFVAAELVQDYQLAVAALLVVVGVVGLSVRADRTADSALPAAVVLRRTGLGRGGVRRALILEQLGVVAVSALAATLAVLLLVPLTPALTDPAPRLLPGLEVAAWPRLLGLLVVLGTAVVPFGLAVGTTALRLRRTKEEVVLRDDR